MAVIQLCGVSGNDGNDIDNYAEWVSWMVRRSRGSAQTMTEHAKGRSFSRYLLRTGLAVAAAAALGGVATDPGSSWYRRLRKPRWQPPPQTFGVVWPPLYALIAYAGARALASARSDGERAALARSFGVNLALNAAWTPLFFRAHAPRLALADLAALNASNLDLLRRFGRADRRAAAALTPYLAWTAFATALNATIAARNPDKRRTRIPGWWRRTF
mgnify:CR=1 FL=1